MTTYHAMRQRIYTLLGWTDIRTNPKSGQMFGVDPEGNAGTVPDPFQDARAGEWLREKFLAFGLKRQVEATTEFHRELWTGSRGWISFNCGGDCGASEEPTAWMRERVAFARAALEILSVPAITPVVTESGLAEIEKGLSDDRMDAIEYLPTDLVWDEAAASCRLDHDQTQCAEPDSTETTEDICQELRAAGLDPERMLAALLGTEDIAEAVAEVKRLQALAEVRAVGCACGDDEACMFVRQRDAAHKHGQECMQERAADVCAVRAARYRYATTAVVACGDGYRQVEAEDCATDIRALEVEP